MTFTLDRLSLNQITLEQWTLAEFVDGCARMGIEWIAPWRHKVAEVGVTRASRRIQEHGLRVSSLCRGGFFTGQDATDDDNRRALEEAAELGAPVLILVCGPPSTRDLAEARSCIAAGIERLIPYALELGVQLAIEPLHPMMIADRSAIVTVGEAVSLARELATPAVGLAVDAYHVFWDPRIAEHLAEARGLVSSFHISDWVTPFGDVLASRVLPGDGMIDLPALERMVAGAGYCGPIEVEVINAEFRTLAGEDVLTRVVETFTALASPEVPSAST